MAAKNNFAQGHAAAGTGGPSQDDPARTGGEDGHPARDNRGHVPWGRARRVELEQIERICKVLGCKPGELFEEQ